jgi:hypothetical protein
MNSTMPCGYVRTGKLKDHLRHYRACSHPECKARLARAAEVTANLLKLTTIKPRQ